MNQYKTLLWVILTIGSVGVLLALGTWQMQRLNWKQAKIAAYEKAAETPAMPVASFYPITKQAQFRRVSVQGEWINDKELHLGGRRWRTETGYQILAPLKAEGGKIYLINRGWVPSALKEPATRKEGLPEGLVEVQGMIRLPERAGMFTPENHPEKNFWFRVDIAEMEKALDMKLEPMTIEVIDPHAPQKQYPIPQDGKVVLRNDHLGYAITWYMLAIAAAVIGVLRLRSGKATSRHLAE